MLLAVFFMITKGYAWALQPGAGELVGALFRFFHPASAREPDRWLAMEGVVLLIGFAGATLVGVGFFGRRLEGASTIRSALRAGGWRPILWTILIGYYGWSALSLLSAFDHGYGRGSGFSQVMFVLWLAAPLGATWCAARLLFGRGAWRVDPIIGYITAVAAAFGIAWNGIRLAGLGDAMPLIGAFAGGKLASGVTQLGAIALGCVAVWTGLTLARRRAAAMLGLRTPAPSVPLLVGGAVLGVALTKLQVLDFMTRKLTAGQTATYVGLLALFAAAMLLTLANAAAQIALPAEAAGAAEMPPRAGLLRRASTALVGGRFWRDFLLSLVITVVLVGIAYMTVGQTPLMAAAFIMPLIIFGFLIGPVVMFVIGVVRGRPGFATAPALLLVAIFGYRYASQLEAAEEAEAAVAEAATLNVYPLAAPSRQHNIVVIEDAYDTRDDGMCAATCMQILLLSDYAVAIADERDWRVYRRHHGLDLCRQPAQIKSYVALLATGRTETCIVLTREAPRATALVLRENRSNDAPVKKLLPDKVGASVPEFLERIDGKDRLLGRVVSGRVQPPLLAKQEPTTTALQMSYEQFYAEALKLPIGDAIPTTDAEMTAVLAALEALFPDAEVGGRARGTFGNIGQIAKSEAGTAALRATLERFWQSNDPGLVILGLQTIYSLQPDRAAFAKPAVARLMGLDNVDIMKAAVLSLNGYKADLEFAKAPLAELILSDRIAAFGTDADAILDLMKKVPDGFSPEIRNRAKAELAARPDLADGRLIAVLALITRGDAQNRQETIDWIFSLPDERFERVVSSLAFQYDVVAGVRNSVTFWSESDMETLTARTATVSDARLVGYIRAIQFQVNGRPNRGELRDLIEDRADSLENGSTAEQALGKELRDILRRMDS